MRDEHAHSFCRCVRPKLDTIVHTDACVFITYPLLPPFVVFLALLPTPTVLQEQGARLIEPTKRAQMFCKWKIRGRLIQLISLQQEVRQTPEYHVISLAVSTLIKLVSENQKCKMCGAFLCRQLAWRQNFRHIITGMLPALA